MSSSPDLTFRDAMIAIIRVLHDGEMLFADVLIALEAAHFALSPFAPIKGYKTPEEILSAPYEPAILPYPMPLHGPRTGEPVFHFDVKPFLDRHTLPFGPPTLIYGLLVAQIYEVWEVHLRPLAAGKMGRTKNQVTSDLFGDLRLVRNYISHLVPIEHLQANMKVLDWAKMGVMLHLDIHDIRVFRELLIAELDRVAVECGDLSLASALIAEHSLTFPLSQTAADIVMASARRSPPPKA